LELIAVRAPFSKLNGIQSDHISQQALGEVELVGFTGAVSYPDGLYPDVVETLQTAQLGHLSIKAPAAKQPASLIHGGEVYGIVVQCDLATLLALIFFHVDSPVCRRQGVDSGILIRMEANAV
jgi:hypothetical protein